MKRVLLIIFSITLLSCADQKEVFVDLPNDVTLNELKLDRFSHRIADGGFYAKGAISNGVRFNCVKSEDGTFNGFALSNRNNRSFTWGGEKQSIDSNIFSVYTKFPNANLNYAIGKVGGGESYFTIETPTVVEHVLVANTTYAYLALVYGNQYGTPEKPVANPNIPGGKDKLGVWYTYVPSGVKKMLNEDKDYFKLIAKGFLNGKQVGETEFYLCTRHGYPEKPTWSLVVNEWYKMELSSLGRVDKVLFELDSSDKDSSGNMRTPPYFCLDGIRLR